MSEQIRSVPGRDMRRVRARGRLALLLGALPATLSAVPLVVTDWMTRWPGCAWLLRPAGLLALPGLLLTAIVAGPHRSANLGVVVLVNWMLYSGVASLLLRWRAALAR